MSTQSKHYWTLLSKYLRPQLPKVVLMIVLLLGSIALQLVSPQIIRYFIDTALSGGSTQALTLAAVLFIAIAIVQQLASVSAIYVSEDVGWTATNKLRADLTLHVLNLDMSFHKSRTPGELIERVDGDVIALANFFSQFVVRVLGNVLLAAGVLILLFREDWRVGLVGAAYALLISVFLRVIQKPTVNRWTKARQAYTELAGFLGERISATEDIRANGSEPYVMHRLYHLMRNWLQGARRAWLTGTMTFAIAWTMFNFVHIITLIIGATLFLQGAMTIGTVYLLVHYISQLQNPLDEIRRQITDFQRAVASIGRVEELFGMQRRVADTTRSRAALRQGAPAIAFDNVTFRYDDNIAGGNGTETVLDDISFEVQQGGLLGLLGRTGSGKTTLSRLLFRLYDPTSGTIRFDNVDLRDVHLSDVRRHVGMVTQDVQLFAASIRDNVTFFNRQINDERILSVLEELGLWDWYQSLPHGLDTKLASSSKGLSAGEAQLLAFTRVFLKDPGLVILDEASSRLDPATEQLLERALDRLLRNRTGIIIAHRLSTVQRVDNILILESGRVREYGAREVLSHDPTSRFYSLLQTGLEEALA